MFKHFWKFVGVLYLICRLHYLSVLAFYTCCTIESRAEWNCTQTDIHTDIHPVCTCISTYMIVTFPICKGENHVLPSSYWNHKVLLEMSLRLWSLWGSWSAQRQTSGRYRSTMVCHLLPRKLHSLKSLTCSKVLDISWVKYTKVRHHHRRKSSWGVRPIFLFLFFLFFRTLSLFGSTFWTYPFLLHPHLAVFFFCREEYCRNLLKKS